MAMKQKKRPEKLNLLKPDDIEPGVWQALTAARSGQRSKLARLLDADPGLMQREFWYTRPIHFAVREGHLSVVQMLLDRGDDPTWIRYDHENLATVARDRGHDQVAELITAARQQHNVDRTRPIHEAAAAGDTAKVADLLDRDESQAGVGDGQGWTPLHHAVNGGHRDAAALLIDRRAPIDAVQKGGSNDWYAKRGQRPIDLAKDKEERVMTGFLLARGAEYTLDLAVLAKDEAGVKRLVRSRSGRKTWGATALAQAARDGEKKLVRMLLRGGVDACSPTPGAPKGAALWHAVRQGHQEIAEMLLKAGADPSEMLESSGPPLEHARDDVMKALLYRYGAESKNAAGFVLDDNIDALAALIDQDKEAVSRAGCGSVYTFAVSFEKEHVFDLLLARGVPVPVVTECRTYLWHQPKMTRRLLEAGMDPNLPDWQWKTPLHNIAEINPMYVRHGRSSPYQRKERARRRTLIDLFLEFGADIDAVDEEYRSTPLGWAARQGQEDVVKMLLERGADPNGGERWARPLAWAEKRGYKRIAGRLKRAGAGV